MIRLITHISPLTTRTVSIVSIRCKLKDVIVYVISSWYFVICLVHQILCPFCRLWDLGQQRCVHSYAVHTDSVWALASTPTFSHVYSGGRDLSVSTFFSCNLCSETSLAV